MVSFVATYLFCWRVVARHTRLLLNIFIHNIFIPQQMQNGSTTTPRVRSDASSSMRCIYGARAPLTENGSAATVLSMEEKARACFRAKRARSWHVKLGVGAGVLGNVS